MWTFEQRTGRLLKDGVLVGVGYSGFGTGKNNPDDHEKNEGPIPVGEYTIGPAYTHPRLGVCTMDLIPSPGNEMYGRDLFRMHGDSAAHPGQASHGCPVLPLPARTQVAGSPDRILHVVAGVAA